MIFFITNDTISVAGASVHVDSEEKWVPILREQCISEGYNKLTQILVISLFCHENEAYVPLSFLPFAWITRLPFICIWVRIFTIFEFMDNPGALWSCLLAGACVRFMIVSGMPTSTPLVL